MGITLVDYSQWGGPSTWLGGHSGGVAGVIQNFNKGDVVNVIGAGEGSYRISRIGFVPKQTGLDSSILGTGVAFQTCQGNQMRVAYAEKL